MTAAPATTVSFQHKAGNLVTLSPASVFGSAPGVVSAGAALIARQEDRNGVQRLSPLSHSPAPIVQKGGLLKAFPLNISPLRVAFPAQLEVFYQFAAAARRVVRLFVAEFPSESEGLGVVDLVSAPFSFFGVWKRGLTVVVQAVLRAVKEQ